MTHVLRTTLVAALVILVTPPRVQAQTLLAQEAYHNRFCGSWLFFRSCQTVSTQRINSSFTGQYLGAEVFGGLWGGAAHCLTVSYPEQKCAQSVAVFSDPTWRRIVWGQPNRFLRAWGHSGSDVAGFKQPAGVAMSRAEGEWHVAFVADAGNSRVVVIALGYSCQCVRWLGELNGAESGLPLSGPFDVAWDHATTWTLSDDRVFITDTGNDRVLVYNVNLVPTGGWMAAYYIGSIGSSGHGAGQLSRPSGIEVKTFNCGGYICADVYISDTGNRRVVHFFYDAPNSGTAATPLAAAHSPAEYDAQLIGIARDHYGDILVADKRQERIIKYRGSSWGSDLNPVKYYGSPYSTWQNGNFSLPTGLDVTRAYRTYDGYTISEEGLPFVSTVEQWGPSTGLQTHRLGVEADNLSAQIPDGQYMYGQFLFTGTGQYTWTITNPYGYAIASSGGTVASGAGWAYPSAYVYGQGYGYFTLTVRYQSGYTYDDGTWQTRSTSVYVPDPNPDPCSVDPYAPGCQPPCDYQIYCEQPYSVTAANAAPSTYQLSQDLTGDPPGVTASMSASGLRRVTRSAGVAAAGGHGTRAEDVRARGITALAFGVPRPGPTAGAPAGAPAGATPGAAAGAAGARVAIRIYDVSGRLVRSAVNQGLSPGYYQFRWDAADDRGQRVAPGVYVAVMSAPGFTKSTKLVITR